MKHSLVHGLKNPAKVQYWVDQAFREYLFGGSYAEHKISYEWTGPLSALVKFAVSMPITRELEARVDITQTEVIISCDLPWELVVFEPIIKNFVVSRTIGKEIDRWLEKARFYAQYD